MKIRTSLLILFIVSLSLACLFFSKWQEAAKNNKRLDSNFSILANEVKQIKGQMVTTGILEMKLSEVKENFPELEKHIKTEFDVKLKNVLSYSNTQTIVNRTFKTTVRDSFKLDTIPIQIMEFSDKWIDFRAVKVYNEFTLEKNIIPVPLEQIFFRDKWRLKYILPWKKRPLYQEVKTANPYAAIEFQRTIQIKK